MKMVDGDMLTEIGTVGARPNMEDSPGCTNYTVKRVIGNIRANMSRGQGMALKLRRRSGLQLLTGNKLHTSAYELLSLLIFTV